MMETGLVSDSVSSDASTTAVDPSTCREEEDVGHASTEADTWWDDDVADFTADDVWKGIVLGTAQRNTIALEAAFDSISWDDCGTLEQARAGLGIGKESRLMMPASSFSVAHTQKTLLPAKLGDRHMKSEAQAFEEKVRIVRLILRKGTQTGGGVRGRLVLFPRNFLHAQALDPNFLLRVGLGTRLYQ
mmetsp:Transcript_65894/g.132676  ORF Transcript_65894/g.132676 Transcript_65894/m.132676 type:complete len:188 (-) Transcript_65894:32-595(-)